VCPSELICGDGRLFRGELKEMREWTRKIYAEAAAGLKTGQYWRARSRKSKKSAESSERASGDVNSFLRGWASRDASKNDTEKSATPDS